MNSATMPPAMNSEPQSQKQRFERQQQPPHQSGGTQNASVPLIDGEELIVDARPAWSAFFKYFLAAAVIFLSGLGGTAGSAVGGTAVAGIIVGYVFYLRQRTRYVVTDRRLMIIRGIASTATKEAWMVDVVGLQTGASILERLLGHGHVTVSSEIGSLFGGLTFGGIDNFTRIAEIVRERQNSEKR